MTTQVAAQTALYIYAFISADDAARVNFALERYRSCGIAGSAVECLGDSALAAVVSEVPDENVRPERRNLAAHQQLLRSLMEHCTPLPVSFGTIADSPEAVRRILSSNGRELLEKLGRVRDKVEMGLRVLWDVPNIFEYFVSTHDELRRLRDRIFCDIRFPSQGDKMELGRLFERLRNEDRAAHTDKVAGIIMPCCCETKRLSPRTEREVVNLACLIPRSAEGAKVFEQAVLDAAKLFDNNYTFDYTGSFPPYNFVELNLEP